MTTARTMTTARFFTYKGNLACEIDRADALLNDPNGPDQLGSVISTTKISMTLEAKELIKKAKRGDGSFAPLMLTSHHPSIIDKSGKSSIGILGGNKVHFGTEVVIGRTCTLSVLDDCATAEMEVPDDYKQFIDSQ